MGISFGLAKQIIEHPSYNLGIALPFVAAFYLLNEPNPIVIPLIGFSVGDQFSMMLKIIGVALYYVVFVLFFVLAGGLSKLANESKLHLVWPIITLAAALWVFFFQSGGPTLGLFFSGLSLLYLVFRRFDDGNLSLLLIVLCGGLLSLLSFIAGILWFEEQFAFRSAITSLFGFTSLDPKSLKIGSMMLITVGYVVFYAIFKVDELWD